jgi:hypothetical protein
MAGGYQKARHQQLQRVPPDSDRKARLRGKLVSDVLFCFPALRCHVFSPCRSSRCCDAPKPGKEKQKTYDYRSAILMVHEAQSFLSVFTLYCVKAVARLRGRIRKQTNRGLRGFHGLGGRRGDLVPLPTEASFSHRICHAAQPPASDASGFLYVRVICAICGEYLRGIMAAFPGRVLAKNGLESFL